MVAKAWDSRVDFMRIAAIGFVLLHHSDDYGIGFLRTTPLTARIDDMLTWVALATLFALSGFLAGRPKATGVRAGWLYVKRRLARLYAPFAIALVLYRLAGVALLSWTAMLVNLTLLGPWIGPAVLTLWFVEVLVYYQLVYAIWLTSRLPKDRPWTIPVLVGLITCVAAVAVRLAGPIPDSRLVLYLPAFAGGAVFAATRDPDTGRVSNVWALVTGVVATLITTALLSLLPVWSDLQVTELLASVTTTVAVCALLARPRRRPSALSTTRSTVERAAQQLAYGSYMAYLAQRLVFQFVADLARPLGEWWIGAAVVASIPLVMLVGIALQRAWDAALGRRTVAAGH